MAGGVAIPCPSCHVAAGDWCRRHGQTLPGATLMCPDRSRFYGCDDCGRLTPSGDGLRHEGRQVCPDCAEIVAFWPTIENVGGIE